MLAVPDLTVHRTKLADWFELNCLSAPDGHIGFGTLISASALSEEEQEEDISKEDLREDRLVLCVQDEIARRRKHIGDDYPFRIDEKGESMRCVKDINDIG